MELNGKFETSDFVQGDASSYADTASRVFQALEYLSMIARKDHLTTIAGHIDQALEASLNDYVEEKRAALGAHLMLRVRLAPEA